MNYSFFNCFSKLIFFVLFIFFYSCNKSSNNEKGTTISKIINEITTKNSTTTTFLLQLNANANIKAQNQSQLFFKAMGEIEQINVTNNSFVKAGQIMAVLDNRQAKVAIQVAKDQLNKANYAINKMILEYGGKDNDTTSVKPRFLENMKLQSGYYEAKTALQTAQLQYDNTYLRAPYTRKNSSPTLTKYMAKLSGIGILTQKQDGRNVIYVYNDLLRILAG